MTDTAATNTSILIVDDDESTIEMLSMLLRKHGFQVGTAGNGREALTFLKQHNYDIIISDLKMPDLDGYQLLDIMKTSYREHKVMVMTADVFTRDRLLRRGALEAFGKPFSLHDFVSDIKTLIKERRRTKRFLSTQKIHCELRPSGTETVLAEGELVDISIDGALVTVAADIPAGTKVNLTVYAGDRDNYSASIPGTIVRTITDDKRNPVQAAIYFSDDRDLNLLEELEDHIQLKKTPYLS